MNKDKIIENLLNFINRQDKIIQEKDSIINLYHTMIKSYEQMCNKK